MQALSIALTTADPTPGLSVLGSVKSTEIAEVLRGLEEDELDLLMKMIYKGMAEPSKNNCAILLSWHEKVVEKGGEGVIVRVLCDRSP